MSAPHKYEWILKLPRGVGHTSAARSGCEHHGGVLVVSTSLDAERIDPRGAKMGFAAVPLHTAGAHLKGRRVPVVFDVETVQRIVVDLLEELEKAKAE